MGSGLAPSARPGMTASGVLTKPPVLVSVAAKAGAAERCVREEGPMLINRRSTFALAVTAFAAAFAATVVGVPARAADAIKIGFSMPLTGGLSGGGKSVILAFELWKEDVNAKGGLIRSEEHTSELQSR